MANSARVTNLLEYIPNKAALSEEAWNASPALMIYKLHKDLQLAAKMYPVLDPKTSARTIADWDLTPTFEARSAMDTYPGGQGAVNVALRKNVNKLLYTYLINLLTPYWSKIDKALNVQEYHDDASPLHVRDADDDIIERMPLVSLLIDKIKQKTFKGPVVHNRNFERHIKGFKGAKDVSDTALTTIIAWLDNTDTLWSMLKAYPGCLAVLSQGATGTQACSPCCTPTRSGRTIRRQETRSGQGALARRHTDGPLRAALLKATLRCGGLDPTALSCSFACSEKLLTFRES